MDTDGNTISGYDAAGIVPFDGAPSIRFWGGPAPTDLRECTSRRTGDSGLLVWCTTIDFSASADALSVPSCEFDETYPLVDGASCFTHYFNPTYLQGTWWMRGQASATGVDGSGNTYAFDHWSISGATNSEGTCQEGSTSATCTISFAMAEDQARMHMTAVYRQLVFSGFAQPVDADALNVAKSGRTIPLKWRVTDENGLPVADLSSVGVTVTSL